MMTKDNSEPQHKQQQGGLYSTLIFISLLLTLCTLALSAYIRLAQSGLDCQPWPECYGRIGLQAEQQGIAVLTESGAEMSHKGARMVHRFVASALGIFVTLILLVAVRRKMQGQPGVMVALLVMAATLFLALLGYQTPSRTLPWVTLGNLGGGMLLLALLWWLGQRAVDTGRTAAAAVDKGWIIAALVLLSAQILAGAWVSANFAATACDADLLCRGFWSSDKPFADSFSLFRELSLNPQGEILLADSMALTISMVHRGLALLCFVFLGLLAYRAADGTGPLTGTAKTLGLLLLAQFLLGIASVYFQLPLPLVTLHNLLSALLLLCLVNLLHHTTGRPV